MIFGFNTDVKHGETVYHVQSEARRADQLLQTQVFVRGRCIGKKATSYADRINDPAFSDDQMHEMLKSQHRAILDAVREGSVESLLHPSSVPTPAAMPAPVAASVGEAVASLSSVSVPTPAAMPAPVPVSPEQPALPAGSAAAPATNGLLLRWTNSDAVYHGNAVVMRFRLTESGAAVPGARVITKLAVASDPPIYSQATTDEQGDAEVRVMVAENALRDAVVVVQATLGEKVATHKFRLRHNG